MMDGKTQCDGNRNSQVINSDQLKGSESKVHRFGGFIFTSNVKSSCKIIANLVSFPANGSKSWVERTIYLIYHAIFEVL